MRPITEISDHLTIDLVRKIAEGGMGIVHEAMQNGAGFFDKNPTLEYFFSPLDDNPTKPSKF